MTTKYEVTAIRIIREADPFADLSDLGEYSNTPGAVAIDRAARGELSPREFRYFNPAMTGEETGNPDSPEQDYQRMQAYNRGEWQMMGVHAEAVLECPNKPRQVIRSGGLWGVESDSDEAYFAEVADEELAALRDILAAFAIGIPANVGCTSAMR